MDECEPVDVPVCRWWNKMWAQGVCIWYSCAL